MIHVLHENDAWVEPLRTAFHERGRPFEEWFLDRGVLDLGSEPPDGVFYNRMSASSHTRDHRYGPEYTAAILAWLERHGRRVVNGSRAIQLEVSKVAQYQALEARGVPTPRTVAAIGRDEIIEAAGRLPPPYITKHNRAGKGLGVQLFRDPETLAEYVRGETFEPSVDGITLVQEYVEAPAPFITRVEFVGGRLLYAVRVDTSDGFELCPADACRVDDLFCPVDTPGAGAATPTATSEPRPMFEIVDGFTHPLVSAWERVLADQGIEIAGVEFIEDAGGRALTYDINTNTNYNSEAEARAGRSGMGAIADFLGREHDALGAVPAATVSAAARS